MHINEFIDLIQHETRGSAHTIIAYKNDISTFEAYLTREFSVSLVEVNYQMIRSWVVELMEAGISAKSVNRKISSLKSFYKFLLRKEMIKVNPLNRVISPKIPKRLPNFVEEKKMTNLFANTQFTDNFEGIQDRLLLEIFYTTGMRLSELINITKSNINNSSVKVLGKGNKQRIIPITNRVIELINDMKQKMKGLKIIAENDFLFVSTKGKKLNPKFVYNKVNFYLGQVTSMDKKSPHVLRHTFATHLLNNGADINAIKELLGHSSLAATQVYTHNSIEKLKNIYTNTHPLAG
jgi:integrase/recombinase XerC